MFGDPKFVEECRKMDSFFSNNVIRYIHRRDFAPHLPPVEAGQFEHFGQEWEYPDQDGAYGPQSAERQSTSQKWRRSPSPAEQITFVESILIPFGVEYILRKSLLGREVISGWNRLVSTVNDLPFARSIRSVTRVPYLDSYLHLPFIYSVEDHAPHHYIAKLATGGVMNEFNSPDEPAVLAPGTTAEEPITAAE
jgi:hypothetical protein